MTTAITIRLKPGQSADLELDMQVYEIGPTDAIRRAIHLLASEAAKHESQART